MPEGEHLIPLGRGDIKRAGRDVTVIAWSKYGPRCLAAAERLAHENIEVEPWIRARWCRWIST